MKEYVLIISDNKNHEIILRQKLSKLPLIFIKGDAFLNEKLTHLRFSFIIVDDSENKVEALKIIHAIKNNNNTVAAPILMITETLQKSYIEQLSKAGITDFISLPIASENVYQTLLDTAAGVRREEVIAKIEIPKIKEAHTDLMDHDVINQGDITRVKEAFKKNSLVTLALIEIEEKPDLPEDLSLKVRDNLYCIISLKKDRKGLLDTIVEIRKDKLCIGIVSTEKVPYNNIASMIIDAKKALKRAKESPYGYSF